jgi:hypothetical protein
MGEHRLRCRSNRMAQAGSTMGFDITLAFIISKVIPSGAASKKLRITEASFARASIAECSARL